VASAPGRRRCRLPHLHAYRRPQAAADGVFGSADRERFEPARSKFRNAARAPRGRAIPAQDSAATHAQRASGDESFAPL